MGFFSPAANVAAALDRLTAVLAKGFLHMGTVVNSAGQDLTAAVVRLTTSTSAELTAVAAALLAAKQPNGSVAATDVETAVGALNAASDKLDALTASLTPAAPPPPAGA
jgi:ribonuclease HI